LKHTNRIKSISETGMKEPSEEIIKFFIREIDMGKVTQSVLEKFKPIAKKALGQCQTDLVNERLDSAITAGEQAKEEEETETTPEEPERKIITTEEELEAYFIIKTICKQLVDPKRITHKDTLSYFSVLLDSKSTKWICRLFLEGARKYLAFPTEDKS